jgi:hypothetical protein
LRILRTELLITMITTFPQHELKSFWRSRNTGKNLAVKIVMGILILYLLLCALSLGFFMDRLLYKLFPKQDVIVSFSGIILVYFMFEFISRTQLQELPTLKVQPYLQLPVKRNSLVQYLALTSIISPFNLIPILLFMPFIAKVIAVKAGGGVAWAFVVAILGLITFNNYLALYIKRKASVNGWILVAITALLVFICLGDFVWHIYSIRDLSYHFFGHLFTHPILSLVPVLLAVAMYYVNFLYLKDNLYLEELSKKVAKKSSTEYPFLDRFGIVGDLVANEIKLTLRNKRPNSAIKVSCMFLFYGLLFYTKSNAQHSDYLLILISMLMSGIFIINYGQFMFSWQGSHFDGLLVSKMNFDEFLKAKFLLFTMVSTITFILTTPYAYFGWRILLVQSVMYLWNIGVSTTIILYAANYNAKRIDLSKGASFNWEGTGATQWLLAFPLFLPPIFIYMLFKWLSSPNIGLAVIAATGLIFILTRNFWIEKLKNNFYKRKYTIAEGFRNK